MKTAVVVLSDPKSGSDESLGRVFNALATAYDVKQKGEEVEIVFQGAGSRWPAELTKPDHETGGTRRYWEFAIEETLETDGGDGLTSEFIDWSPFNP